MARSLALLAARASSLAADIADDLDGDDRVDTPPVDHDARAITAVLPDLGLARLLDFIA